MELFTKQIADKVTDKNFAQNKIKNNLDILKSKEVISDEMIELLKHVYYTKLYTVISDKISHKRNDIPIRDGEFILTLIESYISYLIKKVIE